MTDPTRYAWPVDEHGTPTGGPLEVEPYPADCPSCAGVGWLRLAGDTATPCPECNPPADATG